MIIRDEISTWCRRSNAARHTGAYLILASLAFGAGVILGGFFVFVALMAGVGWWLYAPKPIQNWGLSPSAVVPDDLLRHLAASGRIPAPVKRTIADALKASGDDCIPFSLLYDIDAGLSAAAQAKGTVVYPGYTAMVAYATEPPQSDTGREGA